MARVKYVSKVPAIFVYPEGLMWIVLFKINIFTAGITERRIILFMRLVDSFNYSELKSAQKIVVDKTLEPKKLNKLLDPLN